MPNERGIQLELFLQLIFCFCCNVCAIYPIEFSAFGHSYTTKYGVSMNISEELKEELEWHPKKRSILEHKIKYQEKAESDQCSDDAVIINYLMDGYDKFKIPGGGNVKVDVEIWIQEVSKIIEVTSEFELDVYVTEFWNDPNLSFAHLNPCKQNISVDGGKLISQIWNPLGCFVNSKDAAVHRSPFSNIFLQLYSNGSVWHNYRIKLIGPCMNTFRTFPIDQQRCMLFYESFNHNNEQVKMEWTPTPIILLKQNITLPDYILVDFHATSIKRLYPPGLFNELIATFTFQRLYGFYILQVYIPAYISVFMSWIQFFLGSNIPSRTIIGVNSLLSLTYQFGSVVNNLPKTSDVKAIDVMILMAMGFIFSSLIELAFIGYLTTKSINAYLLYPKMTAREIDKASAIIFPACFVIFNLWYWFIFMKPG